MASRRWLDGDILAKIGGGLIMVGVPLFCWFALHFITRGLFIVGALGIAVLFWGLFSIGDMKNDWE